LSLGGADNQEELTMKCIVAIAVAAAFLAFPAAVQSASKGKGHTGLTPGHEQEAERGGAKNFAPGQKQVEPGGAKDLAPGHEAKDLAPGHEAKDLAPGHEAKDLAQGAAQGKKK
jgi:hypothetical protein